MPDKGATHQRVKCSTPSRMIEEILAVEIEVDSDKAVMVGRLKSVTPTNGTRTGMVSESLAEGGVITPDRPSVITCSNAGTVENTATMKRSVGDSASTGQQLTNYASNSDYDDRSGMSINHATDSDYGDRCRMFVMRHEAHSMLAQASTRASASNNVWFVNS